MDRLGFMGEASSSPINGNSRKVNMGRKSIRMGFHQAFLIYRCSKNIFYYLRILPARESVISLFEPIKV